MPLSRRVAAYLPALALALLPVLAFGHSYAAGAIKVGHPWSRATPPGAQVAGGFLTITNTGKSEDRLIGVSSPLAKRVEVHQMKMDKGVMRMRRIDDGLVLAAGTTVTLAPGGYHLMFIGPSRPFVVGDRIKATLVFRDAGKVDVEFAVDDAGATKPSRPSMPANSADSHAGH